MTTYTTDQIAKMLATITVTAETDGTFVVREDGEVVTRWPSKEIADRRADHMRRYNAECLAA